jgi:hypothetical protein
MTFSLGYMAMGRMGVVGVVGSLAAALLNSAGASDGWAVNFSDNSLVIRDLVTPANSTITNLPFTKFSHTCATVANYYNSAGLLAQAAINAPRYDYDPVTLAFKGILHEGSRTNSALFCRDFTNAAWVKTNATATLTATGIDGVANSASTITATAASATVLQTIVATVTAVTSFSIRRRTGSGTVQISQDGATWLTVTLTSSYQRFQIAGAALVNPVIGVLISTSGDAIDIDYSQLEPTADATEMASSPILTTTVAVARAATLITIPSTAFNLNSASSTGYILFDMMSNATAVNYRMFSVDDNTTANRFFLQKTNAGTTFSSMLNTASVSQGASVVSGINATIGPYFKLAGSYTTNNIQAAANAVAGSIISTATAPSGLTRVSIGSHLGGNHLFGHIMAAMYLPTNSTPSQLTAMTS